MKQSSLASVELAACPQEMLSLPQFQLERPTVVLFSSDFQWVSVRGREEVEVGVKDVPEKHLQNNYGYKYILNLSNSEFPSLAHKVFIFKLLFACLSKVFYLCHVCLDREPLRKVQEISLGNQNNVKFETSGFSHDGFSILQHFLICPMAGHCD